MSNETTSKNLDFIQIEKCAQMRHDDQTIRRLIHHLKRSGAEMAEYEHPGYVRIRFPNSLRVYALGTVNGPWQADVYEGPREERELRAARTLTVPESHHATPEGIARWIAGDFYGGAHLKAYASAAEERKANRQERGARNG